MGSCCGSVPCACQDRSSSHRSSEGSEWDSLDPSNRLAVARLAGGRIWTLGDNLRTFRWLECRRIARPDPQTSAGGPRRRGDDRRTTLVCGRNYCASASLCCWRREKKDPEEPVDHALGRSRGG